MISQKLLLVWCFRGLGPWNKCGSAVCKKTYTSVKWAHQFAAEGVANLREAGPKFPWPSQPSSVREVRSQACFLPFGNAERMPPSVELPVCSKVGRTRSCTHILNVMALRLKERGFLRDKLTSFCGLNLPTPAFSPSPLY